MRRRSPLVSPGVLAALAGTAVVRVPAGGRGLAVGERIARGRPIASRAR